MVKPQKPHTHKSHRSYRIHKSHKTRLETKKQSEKNSPPPKNQKILVSKLELERWQWDGFGSKLNWHQPLRDVSALAPSSSQESGPTWSMSSSIPRIESSPWPGNIRCGFGIWCPKVSWSAGFVAQSSSAYRIYIYVNVNTTIIYICRTL